MVAKSLLVAVLAMLLAIGCTSSPSSAQLAQLAAAAPEVLNQGDFRKEIPATDWPLAVAQLSPERVYSSPEGLYVVLSSSFVQERGVFVPRSADFSGGTGTDPSYTSVGQGVFSYLIKG